MPEYKFPETFGMFSEEGNKLISDIIKHTVKGMESNISIYAQFYFIYDACMAFHKLASKKEFSEAYDTEVRIQFLNAIDLITHKFWGWVHQDVSEWVYKSAERATKYVTPEE